MGISNTKSKKSMDWCRAVDKLPEPFLEVLVVVNTAQNYYVTTGFYAEDHWRETKQGDAVEVSHWCYIDMPEDL